MTRVRHFLLCVFVLSLLIVPCRAFAIGLEAAVGYWMQAPSGTLSYQPLSAADTVDLKSDLNYDTKYQPYARIKVETPLFLPNVYLMATPMSFDGIGSKTFNFGGNNYTAGYESKLKLDHYDVALYYSLPFLKTATLDTLNVEVGINARAIDFEVRVTDGALSDSKRLTVPVPMIYVGVQIKPVKAFSIEAEGRGIAIGSNHYFDIIGRAKVMVFGPLFFSAGYRYEAIKIDESDVNVDLKFGGPFVELGMKF